MTDKSRIRIYGSETCSFCMAARMLLKKKGLDYEDIPIGGDEELRRRIEELSGQRTVPQIFIDDRPIGGFDELYELEKSGDLDRLMASGADA
jgi:glutaredoxin 3